MLVPMLKLALTGGVSVGKSTALQLMNELGCSTISSDAIVKELIQHDDVLRRKLKIAFNCLDDEGNINKKVLSKIIFNDDNAKQKLEELIHPLVKIVREEFFARCKNREDVLFAVCETPLFFEKGLEKEFDCSVLITASLDLRIDRFIESGKGDQKKFFQITKNQMLDIEKKQKADFVINNNGSKEQLRRKIRQVLTEINEKYGQLHNY